ncbi:secreted protein [Streptomyces albus]|uniref:Secreted protein n=1 Tax=Streptomyces albus (strain ATCC 21838 / DSM 41398 / FERM P-419 / JCM 4703 / NBRC 107858) TaxID=1081613 RepID=A0A0B5F6C5_STRA4|nr:secreted protein [Streptomyces albus]AOU80180.1 secreted protein [Streptomyces albus]AYN35896.1 secreted protein [Streptomyces albus]
MTAERITRRRIVIGTLVLALLAAGSLAGLGVLDRGGERHLTAYFTRSVGLYEGSDLRILGVRVGSVTGVHPEGRQVRVELAVDAGVKVPAGARAVIVAPSVVADRYVQLTPAWTKGPQLKDGATLAAARNATPVEVDQLYESVTELSRVLGPEGANKDGALSELLDTGAANLDGNGEAIGDSLEQFGKAAKTLDGSSKDLFATLTQLQRLTTLLKKKDGGVRRAQESLGDVTRFLGDNRNDLSGALRELGKALGKVKTFIDDHRGELKKNVDRLVPVTQALVDQRRSLAEALDTAPLAAGNLLNAYNPEHRTLDGRANLNELSMGGPLLPFPAVGAAQPKGGGR